MWRLSQVNISPTKLSRVTRQENVNESDMDVIADLRVCMVCEENNSWKAVNFPFSLSVDTHFFLLNVSRSIQFRPTFVLKMFRIQKEKYWYFIRIVDAVVKEDTEALTGTLIAYLLKRNWIPIWPCRHQASDGRHCAYGRLPTQFPLVGLLDLCHPRSRPGTIYTCLHIFGSLSCSSIVQREQLLPAKASVDRLATFLVLSSSNNVTVVDHFIYFSSGHPCFQHVWVHPTGIRCLRSAWLGTSSGLDDGGDCCHTDTSHFCLQDISVLQG